jgi:hypothetical protein
LHQARWLRRCADPQSSRAARARDQLPLHRVLAERAGACFNVVAAWAWGVIAPRSQQFLSLADTRDAAPVRAPGCYDPRLPPLLEEASRSTS